MKPATERAIRKIHGVMIDGRPRTRDDLAVATGLEGDVIRHALSWMAYSRQLKVDRETECKTFIYELAPGAQEARA